MKFETIEDNTPQNAWTVYSVGGGALAEEGENKIESPDIYELDHLSDIQYWCEETGKSYWEYVQENEGKEIWDYLATIWAEMKTA